MTYDKDSIEFLPLPTHPHFRDVTGQVFNGITVLGLAYKQRDTYQWFVRCPCGKVFTSRIANLKNGNTKSCGCVSAIRIGNLNRSHGASRTFEYRVWCGMKTRCLNSNDPNYVRYGDRGITICDRWIHSFENFLTDMGKAPSKKHSIERRANAGNYCSDNCYWGTKRDQANNTRSNVLLTFEHQTKTLAEWAREKELPYKCLHQRIKTGWSIKDALTTPPRPRLSRSQSCGP